MVVNGAFGYQAVRLARTRALVDRAAPLSGLHLGGSADFHLGWHAFKLRPDSSFLRLLYC